MRDLLQSCMLWTRVRSMQVTHAEKLEKFLDERRIAQTNSQDQVENDKWQPQLLTWPLVRIPWKNTKVISKKTSELVIWTEDILAERLHNEVLRRLRMRKRVPKYHAATTGFPIQKLKKGGGAKRSSWQMEHHRGQLPVDHTVVLFSAIHSLSNTFTIGLSNKNWARMAVKRS